MAKNKSKPLPTNDSAAEPVLRASGTRVTHAAWWFAAATLVLSGVALLVPEARLWAVHQFAFLHLAVAIPLLLGAAFLLTGRGQQFVQSLLDRVPRLSPYHWSALALIVFMLFSVYGSLLGDGQLSITRLAHVGDMIESGKRIPPGRFIAQKEPGTMLLHEAAFRIGLIFAPDFKVPEGRAGQQARVDRQLVYRGIAQWVYRILSSLAGALLVLALIRFIRARQQLDAPLFWLMILSSGAWLAFFGYVENYAWVSLLLPLFLMSGVRAIEPPRALPIWPIVLFVMACAMHFMAIILLPALIYLLWTLHFEPRDKAEHALAAPDQRGKRVAAYFVIAGLVGYLYVKGWRGWVSVIPLLPSMVEDGYALLSLKHGADLVNLLWWAAGVALLSVLLSKRASGTLRERNQENFLLLAAGSGAIFAFVFSPNLGMARDWDIVSAALWPLIFWGAWRVASLAHESELLPKLRASLLALIMLLLVPAVLVQAFEPTAIERFRALLTMDRSRSSYGWENLALYYQRTGELEKRVEAWQNAVDVERNPRYLFNLAEALKLSNRLNEADTLVMAAATMNRDYAKQLFYYAAGQATQGNFARTKALVDTAVALVPDIQHGKAMQTWANRAVFVNHIVQGGDTAMALQRVAEYMKLDSTNTFWKEYEAKLRGGK